MRYMHSMTMAKNHEIFRPHSYIIYTDLCFFKINKQFEKNDKKRCVSNFLKSGIFCQCEDDEPQFFLGAVWSSCQKFAIILVI